MLGGLGRDRGFLCHDRDFWPRVATEILCCDKAWDWARLGSRQGSPCVTTEFSQGWAIPVTIENFMSQ